MRRFRLKPDAPEKYVRHQWLKQAESYDGVVLDGGHAPSGKVRLFHPGTEEWEEVPMELLEEVTAPD
jgi:hypothetical protein